jgi:hypothetical protein
MVQFWRHKSLDIAPIGSTMIVYCTGP